MDAEDVKHFISGYARSVQLVLDSFAHIPRGIDHEVYEASLLEKASRETGFTEKDVGYLGNPFHWVLFGGDSPTLRYISGPGRLSRVVLSNNFNQADFEEEVLGSYKDYLLERMGRL